jgi:hypothetical protein
MEQEIGVFNLDGKNAENSGEKVIQNQEYTFTMEFYDYEVDEEGVEIPESETPIPFDPEDKFLFVAYHEGKEVFRLERNAGITVIGDDLNILRFEMAQEQTKLLNPKFELELMIVNSQDKNRYYVKGKGETIITLARL